MSDTVKKLVRHGFTSQQAQILEEMYPEVVRHSNQFESDAQYRLVEKPVGVLSSSAVAASCTSTGTDEVLASFTIPAGEILENSILLFEPLWTYTNSANNKVLKIKVGGVTIFNVTRTTSVKDAPLVGIANRNSLTSQINMYDSYYVIISSTTPQTFAIDFSADVIVEITGQRASGSDTLTLEYFCVLHRVGD